jgi:diguanylate cyclase (GGDEF)-like protein
MRERLQEFSEYRFEYRRKCGDGVYRYHEAIIRRDDLCEDALCAVMTVKEIEEEVQMRLQLEEALTLAYTDHLTGLYNQQGLLNRCKELLKDKKVSAALLFMDLDNFKSINDLYGHGMGDKVLHEVGKVLREETRGKDVVGRYGGDEFVVLVYDVPNTQAAEEVAKRIANRINEVCKKLKLKTEVTASIGLSFTGQTGYDYHHLKEIADDRLYLAKSRGKNRIVKT